MTNPAVVRICSRKDSDGPQGGYNLRSTANSVFACAEVLLGDKFTFNTLEKQPHESASRVIEAVRNELKTCWPVLTGKLPENVSPTPSEVHFLGPEEIQAVSKRGRETSGLLELLAKWQGPAWCLRSTMQWRAPVRASGEGWAVMKGARWRPRWTDWMRTWGLTTVPPARRTKRRQRERMSRGALGIRSLLHPGLRWSRP
ncbi:hypothetical protein SEVIR_2G391302v4 [Setaria viridis]